MTVSPEVLAALERLSQAEGRLFATFKEAGLPHRVALEATSATVHVVEAMVQIARITDRERDTAPPTH